MMMVVLLAALFAAAVVTAPIVRRWPRGGPVALALVPAAGAGWLVWVAPQVVTAPIEWSRVWVPALDLAVALRLDALGLVFALLVCGVGAAVVVYAGGYLRGKPTAAPAVAGLLAFAGAMLGLVLADDLLWLFVCWEATSIASYLLVGLEHEKAEARAAARRALLVTAGGGLALLGGLLGLGLVADEWRISAIGSIAGHPAYGFIAAGVLVGAATKSAQWPFQFWLPGAMAAPTPISAYLHSATMVKAGVFLVLRLGPALGGTAGWQWALMGMGAATAIAGGALALGSTDLKRLLAATTIGALGVMMLLVGVDTPLARGAAVAVVAAHGLYKGALFMVAGGLEKAGGSRDVRRLWGLGRRHRWLWVTAALAGLSMAGVVPLAGFVAKETAFVALLAGGAAWGAAVLAVAGAAFVFVALAVAWEPLAARRGDGSDGSDGGDGIDGKAAAGAGKPLSPLVVGPPLVLAVLGLVSGVLAGALGVAVVDPFAGVPVGLAVWHGFGVPLALSAASVVLGWLLWRARRWLRRRLTVVDRLADPAPHDQAWAAAVGAAKAVTAVAQPAALRASIAAVLLVAAGLGALALLRMTPTWPAWGALPDPVDAVLVVFLLGGALGAARARRRLGAIAALGAVGFGVALFFLRHGAPDLAITQFLVEALTVVLLVLAFERLGDLRPARRGVDRTWAAVVAGAAGVVVALLVWRASAVELGPGVSDWFAAQSLPAGRGANVVNVILVDFRALDTLGEIAVLGVAALGVGVLLARRGDGGDAVDDTHDTDAIDDIDGIDGTPGVDHMGGFTDKAPDAPDGIERVIERAPASADGIRSTVILETAARYLGPAMLVFAAWLLWRGHNAPGGGFAAGLVAGAALILRAVAFGPAAARRWMRAAPATWIGGGLLVALGAGFAGLVFGEAFLDALWFESLPLGTPLLFDAGVCAVVLGVVAGFALPLWRR